MHPNPHIWWNIRTKVVELVERRLISIKKKKVMRMISQCSIKEREFNVNRKYKMEHTKFTIRILRKFPLVSKCENQNNRDNLLSFISTTLTEIEDVR